MKTKATLIEAQELRDKIALCALRTETRELIDVIRQEVAARVRMMKERLDRTDHELMRQLEESFTSDRSDKFASISQQLEAKAEREAVDKVSETSQQLYSELQALHVRTQTLGQGMKVVLGWFEGMADKVTGLQGQQKNIQHQIAVQKEETAVALNEQAKATLSRVRNLVSNEGPRASMGITPSGPPSGFHPAPPSVGAERSRPRTAAAGGSVVLKPTGSLDADTMGAESASFLGDGDSVSEMPRASLFPGGSGPAGSALEAARSPRLSLGAKVGAGTALDGASCGGRPSTAPFKTEAERRRYTLDKKRADLVEARLPKGGVELAQTPRSSEPTRDPLANVGSPDPRLGFTQQLAPVPVQSPGK